MGKNKISINFPEKKLHIFNFLKSKDNISLYVAKLVENDMNNENSDLEIKIRKIIEAILEDKQLTISNPSEGGINTNNKHILSTEDISLIKDLF